MDLNYLRRLIKLVDESTLSELEIEEENVKIKLSKKGAENTVQTPYFQYMPQNMHSENSNTSSDSIQNTAVINAENIAAQLIKDQEADLYEIKSPIVGTFYRAPSPETDPFVEIGSVVSPGTVMCIIEAMKLMNEIESDVQGTVVKILVENGAPVEYNQPLFLIKTK